MIKSDMDEFMKEITIELDDFERDAEDVIKKSILISHGTITTLSPVDSGRYKGSHFISKGIESNDIAPDGKTNYSGDVAERAGEARRVKPKLETMSWFVTNNLEYAEALEGGHSDQAPNGVYTPATIIANRAIQAIVRRLNNVRRK
jgi:hypothetical protein